MFIYCLGIGHPIDFGEHVFKTVMEFAGTSAFSFSFIWSAEFPRIEEEAPWRF